MELEQLICEQAGFSPQELHRKLSITSDERGTRIQLKEEVSRGVFRKIANIVKSLGGEYVPKDRCFYIPAQKPAAWDDVAAVLEGVPEGMRSNLCFEIVIRPIGFLETRKFKQLAAAVNRLGGVYLSDGGYFKLSVTPPKANAESGLLAKIQDMNTPAFQRAVLIQRLIDEHNFTQERLASRLKRSRSWIANHLRLLQLRGKLPDALLNQLTEGAARALLSASQERLAKISSEYSQRVKKGEPLSRQAVVSLIKETK